MRRTGLNVKRMALAVLVLASVSATRAASVPVSESFEGYTNGHPIVSEADWSGATAAGIVTNAADAIAALTTYTNAGGAFPLPGATHAKVLQISEALTNSVASAVGGVVISEMLFMPAQRVSAPAGSSNYQFACYVDTNDLLVVWHRGASSNEWVTLTNSPALEAGVWARVAIHQAYASHRYKVVVNEGAAIVDGHGWSAASGGSHPGAWFDMVQTNGYMTRFRTEGDSAAYLDDMVFTNRAVSYSGTTFAEATANDGSIVTTHTITLSGDTFVNTPYSAGVHFSTSGVPAGLSVDLAYQSPTQVSVTLTGEAAAHTVADGTNMMGLTLGSAMFTLGNAADVTGYTRSDWVVAFDDPPVLGYDTTAFLEDVGGAIANDVLITLSGDTVAVGGLLTLGLHYELEGDVPSALVFALTNNGDGTLSAQLSGTAVPSEPANSTNLVLTFKDAAFAQVAASNIIGYTQSLDVTFVGTPVLLYSATVFPEVPENDGTITNIITMTLAGDGFAITGDLTAGVDYALSEAPPSSLLLTLNSDGDKTMTATLTGAASAHEDSDGKTVTLTLSNSVFNSGQASLVDGYTQALEIDLDDSPVLSYDGTAFVEAPANKGTIDTVLVATLGGTTLAKSGALALTTDYTITGGSVPAGLVFSVVSDGTDKLTISLGATATVHTAAAGGSFDINFTSAVFTDVAPADITDASKTVSVSFDDAPVIAYSRTDFDELSGGAIDNTTPLTLTLSGIDSFAAGPFAEGVHFDVATLPLSLSAVLTRNSGSQATLTLTGTADDHANINDTSFTLTLRDNAFGVTDADQVAGYQQVFSLNFNDGTLTINPVPYTEAFETYADGYILGAGEGWAPEDVGVVTTETAIVSALTSSLGRYPNTNIHSKVLCLSEETSDEIKSGAGGVVFSDMMFYVTARESAPDGSTDHQFAMFVDTNQLLNVWHRDTSGTPTNTWETLAGVTVSTSAWHRVTVEKDYAAQKYRLYLGGSITPIDNPTSGDDWFNMVGTGNAYMSRLRVLGGTATIPTYLDDLRVAETRPRYLIPSGSTFLLR